MIEDLGPDARSLLSAAREGLSPGDAIAARVRAKVASAVGGAGASAVATSSTPTTAVAGTSVLAKLAVVGVIAGVVIGGAVLIATRDDGRRTATEIRPQTTEILRPALALSSAEPRSIGTSAGSAIVASAGERPDDAPTPTTAGQATATTKAREMTPATNASLPTAANARGTPAGQSRATPSASQTTTVQTSASSTGTGHGKPVAGLAREVELIDLATRSLRDRKPQVALDAVHAFERETSGRGQLAEEAAAIEIEALCALHEPAAASKLEAFDLKWPSSAQRSRLTTSCKTP